MLKVILVVPAMKPTHWMEWNCGAQKVAGACQMG